MINKKLIRYIEIANNLKSENRNIDFIIEYIKSKGASYAITFRTLEKLGYKIDEIDSIISKSRVWVGFERSVEDMFFDFVELDDDLIEPENQ